MLAWAAPARAVSLSARTNRLLDRLQQLGVVIDRLERCGPGAERAAYNMGVNRLCLAEGLRDEPGLQLDVLTHEAHPRGSGLSGWFGDALVVHDQPDAAGAGWF